MAQAGIDEMRRIIREVDPPRPSTRSCKTLDGANSPTVARDTATPSREAAELRSAAISTGS